MAPSLKSTLIFQGYYVTRERNNRILDEWCARLDREEAERERRRAAGEVIDEGVIDDDDTEEDDEERRIVCLHPITFEQSFYSLDYYERVERNQREVEEWCERLDRQEAEWEHWKALGAVIDDDVQVVDPSILF